MEDKIRRFLEETFLFEFGGEVTPHADLFRMGIVDSHGYIQLITFLEREFGVTFTDEEMISSMLVSLDGMVDAVKAKATA